MPDQSTSHAVSTIRNARRTLVAASAAALCATHLSVFAADNPGAHEHGHARLQFALEGSQVDVMLTSPAYNLAGFEHEPRTGEEKARLADIRNWLQTNPLLDTTEGDCTVADAEVLVGHSPESHDDHGHHEEHKHDDHHHEDHHPEEASTHRDYEVTQSLACKDLPPGTRFMSALMKEFPELQELAIEWVSATGQGSLEMTSPDMTFTLGQ